VRAAFLCRPCLDWSERRHHLGGAVGAAILDRLFALLAPVGTSVAER
jgi:hypothetical protein